MAVVGVDMMMGEKPKAAQGSNAEEVGGDHEKQN